MVSNLLQSLAKDDVRYACKFLHADEYNLSGMQNHYNHHDLIPESFTVDGMIMGIIVVKQIASIMCGDRQVIRYPQTVLEALETL